MAVGLASSRRDRRGLALSLFSLSWVSACGPRRIEGPTDTAAHSESSIGEIPGSEDAVSLEDSDAETTIGMAVSSGEEGTTTHSEICEIPSFPDDPASEVLLRIQNDTAKPIFLRGPDCYHEVFAVDPPDGIAGDVTWSCNLTCASAVMGGSCTCEGCSFGFTRIEPGIQYAAQWSGRLFAALELPPCAACIGVDRCQTPFTAPPGLYRLSIEVFAAAPECGPACECEGPQGAHCWLQRPVLEPTPVKLSIDVDHPNARDVSIVVE